MFMRKLGAALRYLDVIFVPFVCIIIYLCVCVFIYVQYTEHIKRERIKRERLAHASMKVYAVASAIPRESLTLRLPALSCLSVYVSHNPKFELWGGAWGAQNGGGEFLRGFSYYARFPGTEPSRYMRANCTKKSILILREGGLQKKVILSLWS